MGREEGGCCGGLLCFAAVVLMIVGASTGDIYATQDFCFVETFQPTGRCAVEISRPAPNDILIRGCYMSQCSFNESTPVDVLCSDLGNECPAAREISFVRTFEESIQLDFYVDNYSGVSDCFLPNARFGSDEDYDEAAEGYACFQPEEADLKARDLFYIGLWIVVGIASFTGAVVCCVCVYIGLARSTGK